MGQADKLRKAWCRFMHVSSTWPRNGHYLCRVCGRRYPVPWANPSDARPAHGREPGYKWAAKGVTRVIQGALSPP
jgi:hypothetical protein